MRIFTSRQIRAQTTCARVLYMRPGAGEARVARVTIVVGAVFSVCRTQAAMAPLKECCRLRSISESYLNVSDYVTHTSLHMARLSLWYATTFRVTFLSVTHHVRTCIRTYVLCENRSSIQSLVLMRSAIML